MTTLAILGIILLAVFVAMVSIAVAHEALPMDREPEWLEDLWYATWGRF